TSGRRTLGRRPGSGLGLGTGRLAGLGLRCRLLRALLGGLLRRPVRLTLARPVGEARGGLGLRLVDGVLVHPRGGGLQRLARRRKPLELLPVARLAQDRAHRVTGLRAHRQPVLHPLGVHLDPRGVLLRVVDAEVLDRPAVPPLARAGDHAAVPRVADLTHPQKPDSYGHVCSLLFAALERASRTPTWGMSALAARWTGRVPGRGRRTRAGYQPPILPDPPAAGPTTPGCAPADQPCQASRG